MSCKGGGAAATEQDDPGEGHEAELHEGKLHEAELHEAELQEGDAGSPHAMVSICPVWRRGGSQASDVYIDPKSPLGRVLAELDHERTDEEA